MITSEQHQNSNQHERMGKISTHLFFLLANGEALLMNSAASEEDESVWICMKYENAYLTATTTNGDEAGQIKHGAIDST